MKTIQETLNLVIGSGYYAQPNRYLMCLALHDAYIDNKITGVELETAKDAIMDYIAPYVTLRSALCRRELPHGYDACLQVYKDWKNRPQLEVKDD